MGNFVESAVLKTLAGFFGVSQVLAARLGPYYAKKCAVSIERDIEISTWDGSSTQLDIYTPKNGVKPAQGWPVALLIHGGGFRFFSKESHAAVAAKISELGYLTIAMNYRLSPAFQFPFGLIDVLSVYEWASREAKAYGGNFQELVLAGESAGANFALGVGLIACKLAAVPMFPEKRKTFSWVIPQKMILHCGYHQVTGVDKTRDLSGVSSMVKSRMRMIERDYLPKADSGVETLDLSLVDPLLVLEKMVKESEKLPAVFPEVLIPVGDADPVLTDSVKLSKVLQKLGARESLKVYPGAPHAFYGMSWSKHYDAIWRDIQSFLGLRAK